MTVTIRRGVHGDGIAYFANACVTCPLRDECTQAANGRTIRVGIHEAVLAANCDTKSDTTQPDAHRPQTSVRHQPPSLVLVIAVRGVAQRSRCGIDSPRMWDADRHG
jgi:hypothetical protein